MNKLAHGIRRFLWKLRNGEEFPDNLVVMLDPETIQDCEKYYRAIVEDITNPDTKRFLLFRLDNMLRELGSKSRHEASEHFGIPFMQVMHYGWINLEPEIQSEYIKYNGKRMYEIRFSRPYPVA